MHEEKKMHYNAAALPPSFHVDALWFRKSSSNGSSGVIKTRRYLSKGWKPKTPGRRSLSRVSMHSPIRLPFSASKKRKSSPNSSGNKSGKKLKVESAKKKARVSEGEKGGALRKSSRIAGSPQRSYAEADSEEDDLLMKKEDEVLEIFEEEDDKKSLNLGTDSRGDANAGSTAKAKNFVSGAEKATKENIGNASPFKVPTSKAKRERRKRRGNY